MKINNRQADIQQLLQNSSSAQSKKEKVAMEFERMFARQLVQEMTKGLFKQDDNNGVMSSGSKIYRSHIVDTLSESLAKQEQLGMSDMIFKYWEQRTGKTGVKPESESENGEFNEITRR